MKASEAYDKFILKAEKNGTNDNIATDKARFVELYNEYQIRFLEFTYNNKNEDDFRDIQSLLVLDTILTKYNKKDGYNSFKLPKDYFDYSSAYALGSKGNCSNQRIELPIELKDINRTHFLTDDFTKPSFNYRESVYSIAGGNFNVFHNNDFRIDSVSLSYYRYPKLVQLENPDNPESAFDDSYDLDFDEKIQNRIITASVGGLDINLNSDRWQLQNAFAKKDL